MTYKVQIDDVVRDATPDEVTTIENSQTKTEAIAAELEAQAAALASARAKLAALGLSEAEVKALVG